MGRSAASAGAEASAIAVATAAIVFFMGTPPTLKTDAGIAEPKRWGFSTAKDKRGLLLESHTHRQTRAPHTAVNSLLIILKVASAKRFACHFCPNCCCGVTAPAGGADTPEVWTSLRRGARHRAGTWREMRCPRPRCHRD